MNEKGFMMPMMLGISLIFASLLLTMAGRLESQAFSYERRQLYQQMAVYEMEAIHIIDAWLDELPENGAFQLNLASGLPLYIHVSDNEVNYRFIYGDYAVNGSLVWQRPYEPLEDEQFEE